MAWRYGINGWLALIGRRIWRNAQLTAGWRLAAAISLAWHRQRNNLMAGISAQPLARSARSYGAGAGAGSYSWLAWRQQYGGGSGAELKQSFAGMAKALSGANSQRATA